MTSHNVTRLEGQKAEKFCIFISILVLLILIMLIKIDIMHNAEISQYNLNFTYSDIQYGIKISLPEGWEKVLFRDNFTVIQSKGKKEDPKTTIFIKEERCTSEDCIGKTRFLHSDYKEFYKGNPHFMINSEWEYDEDGKKYTWFSFRVAQELLSDSIFQDMPLPSIVPKKAVFTIAKIEYGETYVTAVIVSDEQFFYDQFEAEEIIKNIQIKINNWQFLFEN